MKKFIQLITISVGAILCPLMKGKGQSLVESSLLFSHTFKGGSARIQGLGGAQTALGGDISSASSNPAGLGMFNTSMYTLSPAFDFTGTTSSFLNNDTQNTGAKFILPNFGIVFHQTPRNSDENKIRAYSFSVSFNRQNDFNNRFKYKAEDNISTIVDYFLDDATGKTIAQFNPDNGVSYNSLTGLAYDNYLIGPKSLLDSDSTSGGPDSDINYFTDVGDGGKDGPALVTGKTESIVNSGALNQWSFSIGANYDDRFYFGGGIGIQSLGYRSEKDYKEIYNVGPVLSMDFKETLELNGAGFNATLGAIYRPFDFVQVGASLVTPTFFSVSETYTATLSSRWDNFQYLPDDPNTSVIDPIILNSVSAKLDNLVSEYTLRTPLKWSVGTTLFLGKHGFVTADFETTNHQKNKLSSNEFDTDFQNKDIEFLFDNAHSLSVGGEYRYKVFRVRAGYNQRGNPYKKDYGKGDSRAVTAGIGLRKKNFHIDMAVINRVFDTVYRPYTLKDGFGPLIDIDNKRTTVQFTIGFNY